MTKHFQTFTHKLDDTEYTIELHHGEKADTWHWVLKLGRTPIDGNITATLPHHVALNAAKLAAGRHHGPVKGVEA